MSDFKKNKSIFGMVHLLPLPGTPFYQEGSFNATIDKAVRDAMTLYKNGTDGCLVQTVDYVYSTEDQSEPLRTGAMTLIVNEISRATSGKFQIGVQIMENALKASIGVAKISGGSFIRASTFIGATLTPFGWVQANPLEIIEYRAKINAKSIKIIADIHSRHFRWPEADKSIVELAKNAKTVGAAAVSIYDKSEEKMLKMVRKIKQYQPSIPIVLAGNTRHENAARMLAYADGAFVGSCFQNEWGGDIIADKVKRYMEIVHKIK